VVFALSR